MKSVTILSALTALSAVSATPTKTQKQPATKRATVPKISTSGNGLSLTYGR